MTSGQDNQRRGARGLHSQHTSPKGSPTKSQISSVLLQRKLQGKVLLPTQGEERQGDAAQEDWLTIIVFRLMEDLSGKKHVSTREGLTFSEKAHGRPLSVFLPLGRDRPFSEPVSSKGGGRNQKRQQNATDRSLMVIKRIFCPYCLGT